MATITKVLISGFEPFGGAKLNPSELLVAELKRIEFKNLELSTVILPVEFDRASDVLLRKVNELKPEMVLLLAKLKVVLQ